MKQPVCVFFCGDVMPGGVLPYQDSYIDKTLVDYMSRFDFRIGTLECAIGTNLSPAPEKLKVNGGNNNVCYARDEDFFRIKELGLNAVSLGNNHSFDLGEEGLKNTIKHLRENQIGFFGAGLNKQEASAPLVVEFGETTLAFIGCCIKGLSPRSLIVATDNSYGVYQPTIEELIEQIKEIKRLYDFIIVMPHWGEEHIRIPPVENVIYAKRMVEAGADAILGSHSHCLAPYVTYKGKPIYYGMGNFLDPDKCLTPPRPFYYPKEKSELMELPKCINYPWSVKQPTLCVCGEDSRLGLAVTVRFDNGVDTDYGIVRLGKDNVLRWYSAYSKVKDYLIRRVAMQIAGFLTNTTIYPIIYRIFFQFERRIRFMGDFRKNI